MAILLRANLFLKPSSLHYSHNKKANGVGSRHKKVSMGLHLTGAGLSSHLEERLSFVPEKLLPEDLTK